VPARKKPNDEHQFKVGDSVSITLHTGLIVDGTVKAIVEKTDGIRLHVDYGINTAPNLLTVNYPGRPVVSLRLATNRVSLASS
jgi:hypothetical protein